MEPEKIKKYYLQEKLIEKILELSKYREVVPQYLNRFGKRPNSINFPGDFKLLVEKGATSFHGSVELWKNPLLIDSVKNNSSLRIGWDLIIDVDSNKGLEYSKVITELLIKALRDHGIKNIDIKFSGNRGFHIGVHREALPEKIQGKEIFRWYPELHRIVVAYLKSYIEKLGLYNRFYEIDPESSSEFFDLDWKKGHKKMPYRIANPEQNWSTRHLFRLPYSLNEKTWLVSLPINIKDIDTFKSDLAKPNRVKIEKDFLKNYKKGEALELVVQALDWHAKNEKIPIRKEKRFYERVSREIPENYFPPCIHNILKGLEDGRKRALFILLNFLKNVGYSFEQIEVIIKEWNTKNKEPLNDSYIQTQLNWHRRKKESIAPPNCFSEGYYTDIMVCEPDNFCKMINNPISYAFKKFKKFRKNTRPKFKKTEKKKTLECPYCKKKYSNEKWYKEHVEKCFND